MVAQKRNTLSKAESATRRGHAIAVERLLEYEGFNRKEYGGIRTELIAAGLANEGDFPGDPACKRVSENTFKRAGRRISIRVRSRHLGTYKVSDFENEHEREARCERESAAERDTTAAAAAAAAAEATKALAKIPGNPEVYRRRVRRTFEGIMNNVVRPSLTGVPCKNTENLFSLIYGDDLGGYAIDRASLEEFDEAIQDATAALQNATVRVNRVQQQSRLLELRGTVAKADPAFGRFLTKALTAAD